MTIQQKYPVYEGITENLANHGVVFGDACLHSYTYLAPTGKEADKSVLRIKSSEGVHKLDFKTRDNTSGDWLRHETEISNPEQLQLVFEKLGIEELKTLLKSFRTWENKFLRMDLVTVDNLFTVLEAKFKPENSEKVKSFLEGLGFDTSNPDGRSVIEIYRETYAEESK